MEDDIPPTLILIIPEARLATLPAAIYGSIQSCFGLYKGGRYYVSVPQSIYAAWPKMVTERTAS